MSPNDVVGWTQPMPARQGSVPTGPRVCGGHGEEILASGRIDNVHVWFTINEVTIDE